MDSGLFGEIRQIIEDCKILNFPDSRLALEIILALETYSDSEIIEAFTCLPSEVMSEIGQHMEKYETTGQYYIISSVGMKDISAAMGRAWGLLYSFK